MIKKGFTPKEEVFISLLQFPMNVMELLSIMNKIKVKPSIRTFNAALKSISYSVPKVCLNIFK